MTTGRDASSQSEKLFEDNSVLRSRHALWCCEGRRSREVTKGPAFWKTSKTVRNKITKPKSTTTTLDVDDTRQVRDVDEYKQRRRELPRREFAGAETGMRITMASALPYNNGLGRMRAHAPPNALSHPRFVFLSASRRSPSKKFLESPIEPPVPAFAYTTSSIWSFSRTA